MARDSRADRGSREGAQADALSSVSEGIKPTKAHALDVTGLIVARTQVLLYGVASQARAPGNLAHGHLLTQGLSPDDTQCRHV